MVARSEIDSAFDILLEEIDHAIEGLNQDGAAAFQSRDYARAEPLGKQGQQMEALRQRLAELREEWRGLTSGIEARRAEREWPGQRQEQPTVRVRIPNDGLNTRRQRREPTRSPRVMYKLPSEAIPKALGGVLAVCHEVLHNGATLQEAYRIRTKERGLSSEGTVPNACLRAIGQNTAQFQYMLGNRQNLVQHLVDHYPAHEDLIRQTLEDDPSRRPHGREAS